MLLSICGCQGDKTAMTDAELERVALTQRIEVVEAKGGLVLMVGGETVTSDEIIKLFPERLKQRAGVSELEQFKTNARGKLEEIVMSKITSILLYQHAKKQAGGNIDEALEKAAESEYRKLVLDHGGDEVKADERLKSAGMDRNSFKEERKRTILIQTYLGGKSSADRPVTYRELLNTYNEMKDEDFARDATITFRLIDIQPARMEVRDPNRSRDERAKDLAVVLLGRLRSGEDFGELAKQYSHGHRKSFGGLWTPVNPESLAAPYNMLAAEAEKTEPGDVPELIVIEGHIFIMKLEAKQSAGYDRFEDVQEAVRIQAKRARRTEVFAQLDAKLNEEAKVGRTDEFVDFCLEKIYQMGRRQP
jgi:hypothetical protein